MTLSPVVAFGAYIGLYQTDGQALDIAKMFTSLVIISLLASPIIHLVQAFPALGAATGCFQRIQCFLDGPERIDYRLFDRSFLRCDGEPYKKNQQIGNSDSDVRLDIVVAFQDAKFSWPSSSAVVLNGLVDILIYRSQFVVVTGPVGCGKSLFLNAILGEAACVQGSIYLSTMSIGYCSQGPWLGDSGGDGNRVFDADPSQEWMDAVLRACGLDDHLINKDNSSNATFTSSELSQGQKKQLVSMFFML